MFKLIKQGSLYQPDFQGICDILICGRQIAVVAPRIDYSLPNLKVIDAKGKIVCPGFIDQHVHLLGGGGEGGPVTRTPEVMLSSLTTSGITTVVGTLGLDTATRNMLSLLAKAHALEEEGITTYLYSGGYRIPLETITGDIIKELLVVDKVIGIGEIAISDHRSAQPTLKELIKLAADARVGGILSGKAGVIHIHIGEDKKGLNLIFQLLDETDIPITQFVPTHINRSQLLIEEGTVFAKKGGIVDLTAGISQADMEAGMIPVPQAVKQLLAAGVNSNQITFSSDGNGSLPSFDNCGRLVQLNIASPKVLLDDFRQIVRQKLLSLSEALKLITLNPAKILKLYPTKGTILSGSDADILIMNHDLELDLVLAKGQIMIAEGKPVVRGRFEDSVINSLVPTK